LSDASTLNKFADWQAADVGIVVVDATDHNVVVVVT